MSFAHLDSNDSDSVDARVVTGRRLPLVDLKIVDEAMTEQPRDGTSTGEVVVRAPWLNAAYLKSPEATDELWRGGYMHTGDVGHIDEAGNLMITDRMKDVIKSGGEWVSSLELETIASAVSGVVEVAAIGISDPKWGERPLLMVVASDAADRQDISSGITAAIREAISGGSLSKWAMPDDIRFVDEITKTSVGKIDKKAIRAALT